MVCKLDCGACVLNHDIIVLENEVAEVVPSVYISHYIIISLDIFTLYNERKHFGDSEVILTLKFNHTYLFGSVS